MSSAKPKPVTAPPVPEPIPVPEVEPSGEAGDEARKKRYRRGRRETFLTGALEPQTTGKKRLLG